MKLNSQNNEISLHISVVVIFEARIPGDAEVLIFIKEPLYFETPGVFLVLWIIIFGPLLVVQVHIVGKKHIHSIFQII
jgi:hypothetical protein